ncbi:MAG: hypothetical protein RR951_05840 [Ruthenibacterium sp.]
MDEQQTLLKKQLFWQRACAVACLGIFIVVLISAVLLVPRIDTAITQAQQLAQQLSAVDWQELASDLNQLTITAQDSLKTLDVEGLNQAVKDLQTAIAPLVRLFS